MKRFVTLAAVAFLVAAAVARWRRTSEPVRQPQRGGREKPAAPDPGASSPPAGDTGDATLRAEEVAELAHEPVSMAQATPAAERRAEELGVELSQVRGTGAGGRITVKDIQNAAKRR